MPNDHKKLPTGEVILNVNHFRVGDGKRAQSKWLMWQARCRVLVEPA